MAARCIKTGKDVGGIEVKYFNAITANCANDVLRGHGLEWTWNKGVALLRHHSYGGNDNARIGCAMSHYALWEKCAFAGEPLLVLEHDSVFIRKFYNFDFKGICQINDPLGATPRGDWWRELMVRRGDGVWPKTKVFNSDRPDGLTGNSAYVIQPTHALMLMEIVRDIGVWPNDAIMCRQLIPDLEEYYPFITVVDPEMSTINA